MGSGQIPKNMVWREIPKIEKILGWAELWEFPEIEKNRENVILGASMSSAAARTACWPICRQKHWAYGPAGFQPAWPLGPGLFRSAGAQPGWPGGPARHAPASRARRRQ